MEKTEIESLISKADKAIEETIEISITLAKTNNDLEVYRQACDELSEEVGNLKEELEAAELRELELKTRVKELEEYNTALHNINQEIIKANNNLEQTVNILNETNSIRQQEQKNRLKQILSLSIGQRVFNFKDNIIKIF
jgi:chromosome segregation ATPase